MRIDRRGHAAYRKIPGAGELEGNIDLTDLGADVDTQPARPRVGDAHGRPKAAEAFSEVGGSGGSLFARLVEMLTAVNRALKDVKQGSGKTFD